MAKRKTKIKVTQKKSVNIEKKKSDELKKQQHVDDVAKEMENPTDKSIGQSSGGMGANAEVGGSGRSDGPSGAGSKGEEEMPGEGAGTESEGGSGAEGEKKKDGEEGEEGKKAEGEKKPEGDDNVPPEAVAGGAAGTAAEQAERAPDDISPSITPEELKTKPGDGTSAKDKAKDKIKDEAGKATDKAKEQVADKAKKYLKEIAKKAAKIAADAASKALAAIGWPYILAGCVIIFILIILIFGALACVSQSGYFGKSKFVAAGADDANVKKIQEYAQQEVKGGGGSSGLMGSGGGTSGKSHKIDFLNAQDADLVKSGQIDQRLAAALVYLAEKHEHIRISHITSGYTDMPTDPESGTFHDDQIRKNISAHKEGLAADIDEIDIVKDQCECGSDIPVLVSWQTLNSSPITGALANNILGGITGATDLLNGDIMNALGQMGVTGLNPNLMNQLSQVTGINSITDLANQNVIDQLSNLGIGGLDNPLLQGGLRQLRGIQELVNINPQNLDQLLSGRSAEVLANMGIPVDQIEDGMNLYEQASLFRNIGSIEDLNQPQIRSALANMGIDPNNGDIGAALNNIASANQIMNWAGDMNNQRIISALTNLASPTEQEYLGYYQTFLNAQRSLNNLSGTIEANVDNFAALSQLGIEIDNPQAQAVFDTYRSAYQVANWEGSFYSPAFNSALTRLGIPDISVAQQFAESFRDANMISTFVGGTITPQIQSALDRFGLNGQLLTSGQLSNSDPMSILERATNLDERYPDVFQQFRDIQSIVNITDLSDVRNLGNVQDALNNFGINFPENYAQLANLGSLNALMNVNNLNDLGNANVQRAMSQLGLPANFQNAIGQLGAIRSLANISSPLDLAQPQIQAAIQNLGITSPGIQAALGQMGSVGALMNIRSPQDLFSQGSIDALSSLGILDANTAGIFGQIGAVQSLMNIQSVGDLLNPNTIMALNSLGLISLSNPVSAGLMAATMIGSMLGINLMGGLGGCDGNTNCYGPTARTNIHKVIEELLQFPYDMNNPNYYKVTQLITFDKERDVKPFTSKLDELYGKGRPANFGLFAMPEAKDHLHIGY